MNDLDALEFYICIERIQVPLDSEFQKTLQKICWKFCKNIRQKIDISKWFYVKTNNKIANKIANIASRRWTRKKLRWEYDWFQNSK